ncbi:hypothetical protein WA577_005066 [Blastocystis sp. JDR]
MIGLPELERVVIGENSFSQYKDVFYVYPSGEFYLKNCDNLRELRIGVSSFSNYASCVIEDNAHLEVVEMGKLYHWGNNFYHASLEMKNLPKVESITIGLNMFYNSPRAVFENMPELTSIRLGDGTLAFAHYMNSTELIMRSSCALTL